MSNNRLTPLLLVIAVPLVLVLIVLLLGTAILTSPFLTIGFIAFLRHKNKRMSISTDYKLKARQGRSIGPQRP